MLQALFGHKKQLHIQQIRPNELYQRLQANEDLLIVDVRTSAEYAADGHIAGSRLLPLSHLYQRSSELPQDQSIVCVCRSGNRSQAACEQLASLGFKNVTNLAGGMLQWRMAKLPTQ